MMVRVDLTRTIRVSAFVMMVLGGTGTGFEGYSTHARVMVRVDDRPLPSVVSGLVMTVLRGIVKHFERD